MALKRWENDEKYPKKDLTAGSGVVHVHVGFGHHEYSVDFLLECLQLGHDL